MDKLEAAKKYKYYIKIFSEQQKMNHEVKCEAQVREICPMVSKCVPKAEAKYAN